MNAHFSRVLAVIAVLMATASFTPTHQAQAAPKAAPKAMPGVRYFAETGHNVIGRIKSFYEANGDIPIFGLPLTEVFVENGLQVQYFERARFELHPELPSDSFVTLSALGRTVAANRTEGAFAPLAATPSATAVFFRESGHSIGGGFLKFWQTNGGLPVFGYPLSEEFTETLGGEAMTVQYFERARFEYHATSKSKVQLSLLGSAQAARLSPTMLRAVPVVAVLGTATTGYFGSFAERVSNIANGAARMNGQVVQPGATFSFGTALGDTDDSGFIDGYAIVNGRLEKVTGGGLCQVSTTMYRAVFYAGLQITSRTPHSYMINFYENIKGFDATVFTPSVDFKWRNDSASPVYIVASTNPNQATVTFTLYGFSDGRKVEMVGPVETNIVKPGVANWQFELIAEKRPGQADCAWPARLGHCHAAHYPRRQRQDAARG